MSECACIFADKISHSILSDMIAIQCILNCMKCDEIETHLHPLSMILGALTDVRFTLRMRVILLL